MPLDCDEEEPPWRLRSRLDERRKALIRHIAAEIRAKRNHPQFGGIGAVPGNRGIASPLRAVNSEIAAGQREGIHFRALRVK